MADCKHSLRVYKGCALCRAEKLDAELVDVKGQLAEARIYWQHWIDNYDKLWDEQAVMEGKLQQAKAREVKLVELLSEIVPLPDDDLTYADGVGWHCGYCGLCADDGDLESFEHHADCWLIRARAVSKEVKDG